MRKYALVKNGIIISITFCDPENAQLMGLIEVDDSYNVGDSIGFLQELYNENKLLKAQIRAQSDQLDFLEDCIAEIAMQVYN